MKFFCMIFMGGVFGALMGYIFSNIFISVPIAIVGGGLIGWNWNKIWDSFF